MALRLYVVPIVGSGLSPLDPRTPKYIGDGTIAPVAWSMADYGFEPWAFVAADLPPADLATVQAQPDAFVIPANLEATLTAGQVTTVQAVLESMPLPAGWIVVGMTWRTVLRTVLHVCAFIQRVTALVGGRLFLGSISLSTTIGQLSTGARAILAQAAEDLGLSTAGIQLASTLRAVLKAIADQKAAVPYQVGPMAI